MARAIFCLLALLVFPCPIHAQTDWAPFRWQAPDGGQRDLEFLRGGVIRERGEVTVPLRRDRATTLRQDPTIAPETNPWTEALIRLDCPGRRWMLAEHRSTDPEGKPSTVGNSSQWIPVQRGTLADALRDRFCPST